MRGRKKSPDTRAAILRCASDVFSRREFHEVLTDDIANTLGIGKGTIYRYFGSKEELYFATIVEGLEGMQEAMTAALREPAPLSVTIRRLVETILAYFWRRRDFFILLHRHEPKLDPRERAEWQQRRDDLVDRLRRVLEAGLPRGSVGRQHPQLAAEILLGMIRTACLYRSETDEPVALAKLVTNAFLHGVRSAGASSSAVPSRASVSRRPLRRLRGGKSSP